MIIGSRRRYAGPHDRVLTGSTIVIIAVHRDGQRLQRDDEVGGLRTGDVVEVAPLVHFGDGFARASCFSHEISATHVAAE